MMRWVVGSSLKSRGLVLAGAAVLVVLGATRLGSMPVDVLPEFGPPTVEVRTEALGLSAVEVEQLITAPMEQDLLNGVAFLDTIRSESVPGLSSIEMIFEPGTDLFRARQVVQERLTLAHGALPAVSKPPQMLQPLSSTSRVMMLRLSSRDLSLIDLSVLARWTVRPRLMGVPGVANVAIWGQRERQLQVLVDPVRLNALKVSLDQVLETTGNALWVSPLSFLEASTPGTGGFIDTPNQRLGIQHVLPIRTAEDLARIPLEGCTNGVVRPLHVDAACPVSPPPAGVGRAATAPGTGAPATAAPEAQLRLGDVATIREDHQPLIGDAVFTDGPGLMLVVEKFPGANALQVTHGVEAALDGLGPAMAGVQVDRSVYRPATYIEDSARNVRAALLVGLLLLMLVLGGLSSNWRLTAVVVSATLLSLVAAVLVLSLRGATMNAFLLAGLVLAVAVLVDDAVGDGERIRRALAVRRAGGPSRPLATVVLDATVLARRPMVYATAIVLLGLVPVLVLRGESGAFLPPLARSYAAAILASMVVALTVTPALGAFLLSSQQFRVEQRPLVRRAQRAYEGALPRVLGRRAPVYALVCVGLAGIGGASFLLQRDGSASLIPSFRESDLLVRWEAAPGTSLPEMNRITGRLADELRALPGVRNVGAHVGRAVLSDQIGGVNSSELWVNLRPGADYDDTVSAIRRVVDGYPGLDRSIVTYRTSRVADVLGDVGRDVTVRLYGQDLEVLEAKAREVHQAMRETHGLADARIDLQPKEPTLEVTVDLEAAQRVGIKPGDVRRAAAALLSGIEVGSLFEDQKVFEVVVWGAPATRSNLNDVRNLLIEAPNGGSVRLGDVAALKVAPNPTVVRHENVSRSIDVGATAVGPDVTEVVEELEDRIVEIAFPLEHHAEILGGHEQREASARTLAAVVAVVALGILLILQASIGSWRLALAVFLSVPVALLGSLVAAAAQGGALSIGSLAGFFAVFAVAVRLGVATVHRAQELDRGPEGPDGAVRVREAAHERLAPTLVSLLAAAAAMLPLALLREVPGSEIVHPLAVVVLGGLATAAVAALFVVPALATPLASGAGWLSGDGSRAEDTGEDASAQESVTAGTTNQMEALDGKS